MYVCKLYGRKYLPPNQDVGIHARINEGPSKNLCFFSRQTI